MSEGADSVAQTCGNSLTTLGDESECESDATTATASPSPMQRLSTTQPPPPPSPPPLPLPPPPPPPPSSTTSTGRRPRFGTGGPPPSPYVWVDGRQLRSALAWTKKWPPRRVSFPSSDNHLVTGYLEPANPWRHAENVNREDLIFAYKESCARHSTEPLQTVLVQLENLDLSEDRCEELDLKGETLDQDHSEPLEEILKRIQFNKINLEGTSLNDESSVILFDMLEYYESARYLNISFNPEIGARGWQACSHMIKKTQCLEQLEARNIAFNEQNMNILSRALRLVCHLHVLKLENCGLSGRAIVILVTALKMNSGIRELYLADNGLDFHDAIQLGSLLRLNNHLQLLDISNNNVQDDGVRDILEGLINQVNEDKTGKGLGILILWNNGLTTKSSPYISRIIALSKTLETLNIGQNMLTDETLSIINESLKKNRVLLQLGMQSTELTCDGIIALAEIMETNQVLQRIDLRDNSIQMRGMGTLANVMKKNKTITQIDLDDRPRIRIDGPLHQYMELVTEIRSYCSKNEERRLLEESTEDTENPRLSNRLLNASSRKISLTCQTLPSPPSRSATSLTADEPARAMLEPKRTSGGRLRSPAPSPIPSPVASPIPSPSRNRFVVCRVPEASLRSTDSSASSSPVTPPSLGSSPCFFGTSGPSRFRVSVVESAGAGRPSSKSVVTSSSGSSVTIGFNVKVQAVDSDDSDSATKANTAIQAASEDTASVETLNVVPLVRETLQHEDNKVENKDRYEDVIKNKEMQSDERQVQTWREIDDVVIRSEDDKIVDEQLTRDEIVMTQSLQSERESRNIAMIRVDPHDEVMDRSNVTMGLEDTATTSDDTEAVGAYRIVYTSTKELQVPAYPNEDAASARMSVVEDKALNSVIKTSLDDTSKSCTDSDESSACVFANSSVSTASGGTSSVHATESHSQEQTNTSVQKHKSSLEKLLSLFQHSGQFFSDSTSAAADARSTLQEHVSGVIAFGDKLQQYLKEGRAKVTDGSWSLEHGSPSRNRSIKMNVTQLQNLTGIFSSFKLEPHVSLVDHNAKFFSQAKSQNTDIRRKDLERSSEIEVARVDEKSSFHQEILRNEEKLLDQERNQVTRNGVSNLFDQRQNQITKDDEKDLVGEAKDQINRDDEEDLLCRGNNQTARDNCEQKLFDQVSKSDNKDSFRVDQMRDRPVRIDEKNFEDREKKQIAESTNENFQIQKNDQGVQGTTQDLQNQQKSKVVSDEHNYATNNQEKVSARSSEDLEDAKGDRIAINDEKDATHNTRVDEKGDSVHKLQWSKTVSSDRPLPESVQSKDNFADNLVLDGDCVTVTNAMVSPLLTSESAACVAIKFTDIAEYPILQLSQADGTGCKNAKHLDGLSDDDGSRREDGDNAQDLEPIEHNNAERVKRDEAEILENNDAGCSKRKGAVEAANASTAMRTCDTTTTDSINQTSDSSFPICNIAHDRKTVDSVSTASAVESTLSHADGMLPMLLDDDRASLTSAENVGASTTMSKDVDDQVTSGACCIADQDGQRDFTKGNEKDSVEVLDDTCRDSAHRRSTSVNIKIESCVSETTRPASESQAVPEGHRERQSSFDTPNAEIHRIIPKYVDHVPEEAIDNGKLIDPSILVTSYETAASLVDKSDAEELIFCMTDISTDGTSVEDDLSPCVVSNNSPNDIIKVAEPFFELPVTRAVLTSTLLIENPEVTHRNSQDSGIEETVLAMEDAHPLPPPPPPARSSLQESVDSGIESECSSICNRVESVVSERALEATAISKRPRDDNGARERNDGSVGDEDDDGDDEDDGDDGGGNNDNDEFAKFTSDLLAKENDSVSGIAHSYLNSIKCTVVSTTHPVVERRADGMTTSGTSMGVVVATDESVARSAAPVIAHSPAALHGTR
ncbi:Leucine-rich repeat-containing protein [Ooceraea biroi]|uniref:Leucine-rich repeat-containing protein n=1 Tax=Ooceraea biroi TaxID=2015173 RepID=A0A026WA07_OOCBI|nr:Leucine-rich repeat-containing protein [Ooceraea biroi]